MIVASKIERIEKQRIAFHPLELYLPPTVNHAFMNTARGARINKPETNEWYRGSVLLIRSYMQRYKIKSFDNWVYCDMYFFLRRRGSDAHNYLKIYNDGLEKAGLVSNDSWVLNRIQEVDYDAKNPRILARFELKTNLNKGA